MDPLLDWATDAIAPRSLSVSNWKSTVEDKIALCSVVASLCPDAVQFFEASGQSDVNRTGRNTRTSICICLLPTLKMKPNPIPNPIPCSDTHLDPDQSSPYSLGIDLGSTTLRYSVYREDEANQPAVHVIHYRIFHTPRGLVLLPRESNPPPDSVELESTIALFGRLFKDPTISPLIIRYPLPIFEHPQTHTCVIRVNDKVAVTPEEIIAVLLKTIKQNAEVLVGSEVCNVSLSVPSFFTSGQRQLLIGVAVSVRLRIVRLISSPLASAMAMKLKGLIPGTGPSVIIDVGESKIEIGLFAHGTKTIREINSGGSFTTGGRIGDADFVKHLLLIIEGVLTLGQRRNAKVVRMTGGGTYIIAILAVIIAAFPGADIVQVDPDSVVACGAAMSGADAVGQLAPAFQHRALATASYSIGTDLTGGVIKHVLLRGETLPAVSETISVLTRPDQTSRTVSIYQGEHYLQKHSQFIGSVRIDGLPILPRGQCRVRQRIEYDLNGILKFSACELTTNKMVNVKFMTRTDFTDKDRARLRIASRSDLEEEKRLADAACCRGRIAADINYAKVIPAIADIAEKWSAWLKETETGTGEFFREQRVLMNQELHAAAPESWAEFDPLPELHFKVIFPKVPMFAREGSAIIRFLCMAECIDVVAIIADSATGDETRNCEWYQFPAKEGSEMIVRVEFPHDGKFTVRVMLDPDNGFIYPANELPFEQTRWRFYVENAPPEQRTLGQLMQRSDFIRRSTRKEAIGLPPLTPTADERQALTARLPWECEDEDD
jgi:molecular chaperone DnaK (HSP70)